MSATAKQYFTINQLMSNLDNHLKYLLHKYNSNTNTLEVKENLNKHFEILSEIKYNYKIFVENSNVLQESLTEAESNIDFYDKHIKQIIEDFHIDESVYEIENFNQTIEDSEEEIEEESAFENISPQYSSDAIIDSDSLQNQSSENNSPQYSAKATIESDNLQTPSVYISKVKSGTNSIAFTPMTKSTSKHPHKIFKRFNLD